MRDFQVGDKVWVDTVSVVSGPSFVGKVTKVDLGPRRDIVEVQKEDGTKRTVNQMLCPRRYQ